MSEAERRARLAAVLRARRAAPAVLAPNQERLFVLQELEPASTAYLEAVVLRLRGPLEREALLSALRALPTRHEWLRSRVEVGAEGPVQVLDDGLAAPVVSTELPPADGCGRDELGEEARAWVRSLADAPLPLREGPLWRAGLARLDEEDHLLVLVVHHIACDATSLSVLVDELGERYDAAVSGETVEPARPASPRDLARAVRALQSSQASEAAVAAHAAALAGADLGARLQPATGAAASAPGPAARCVRTVPAAVARRAARVAEEHGVTSFALLSVAVGAALAQATGCATPVLGVPVDLRWHLPRSEDTVSFLVETVALPLPELLDRSLVEAAAGVRDAVTGALRQPPPFEHVVARLRQEGHLPAAGDPLHTYLTWLDGEEDLTLGGSGPAVTHVDVPLGRAKTDLAWTVVSRGRDLVLRLEHDSARVDAEAAERLVTAAIRLLDAATERPLAPLGCLDLLPAAERERVGRFEGEAAPVPAVDLLTRVRQGLAASEGPVLVGAAEALTGRELLDRADALAARLVAAGVGPGDRVAVPSRRVPAMVVSLLAVLRAGATFLPVDAAHPPARQEALARAAGVGAVVGEPGWAAALAGALGAAVVPVDDGGRAEGPAAAGPAWPSRTPADLAYVMFTSGSTGVPKAVRVPDGAVVARIESYLEVLAGSGVRYLLQSSLTFDASVYLFWVLATGGVLVLPADREAGDPGALARLVERHGATDAFFVPALYEAVLQAAAPAALRSLRRVCVGGDVMPPAVAALHHAVLPDAALLNVYGPTEVVVTCTAAHIGPEEARDGSPLPIGRPHPGTVAAVLDRYGRRVPVGVAGELHLGGPSVADGYDSPDGARDPRFSVREDDAGRPLRWYATGDVVRWREDGQLAYLGRRDRQVKLRGQRVELGEVEAALHGVPGVREAAVEVLGEGAERRLVAFLAPEVAGVREAVAAVLPVAWLPDAVVAWPELPRAASGKLDRAVLRASAAAQQPAARRPAAGRCSALEETVLAVVQELLGDDDLGPDDDFFAVGGNSLLAARLVGRLSTHLGVLVPLPELVGTSTIRGITALVEAQGGQDSPVEREGIRLVQVHAGGALPPAVLIARDGATSLVLQHHLKELDGERPVWTLMRPMPPLGMVTSDFAAEGEAVARVLLERFPSGPVDVFGYSASGVVAVEVARALGERRGATVLLDTVAPPSTSQTPWLRLVNGARTLSRTRRLARAVLGARTRRGVDPAARAVHAVRTHQDGLAVVRTRMAPVDFPVTVLTSEDAREGLGRDDIGWGRVASTVRVVPVPGDHYSLLRRPQVAQTARLLAEALSR
ncbi:non-ribosomal peptide synthetase [Kineococcus xinjiangensis]|uniref:non-ribosomal peptide synthetase n=1 Tax=Kineococcus xinjiangensis TaxID=512762 RepID=UPI001304B017|nr:non-ribosomal peptide synthetase [Kineococcus xinjiangensis]